jgi:RNA polymerase sigma factor (sigma-70 family)
MSPDNDLNPSVDVMAVLVAPGNVSLMAAISAGVAAARLDDSARELVVRMFHQEGRSLVRLASLFVDDRNAAEDIVQEAFIRLARSAHRINDEEKAPAYLRSIVLNLARDHNRRGLVSLRHHSTAGHELGFDPLSIDVLVRDEDHRAVLDAVRALPLRQRDCVTLRYFEDLGIEAIAATLALSPNSVKTHLRRGMAALERKLAATR